MGALRIIIGIDQVFIRAQGILGSTINTLTKLCSVNLGVNQRHTSLLEIENRESVIEIKVDGAFSHIHQKAACGGIIKDAQRVVIDGFCLSLENDDSLTAKLWSCLMCLKQAWDGGHRDRSIKLSSDS